MIAVIDYGVGNLFSLKSSLDYIGVKCVVSDKESDIERCDKLILPGVGAFRDAAEKLEKTGLKDFIISQVENGKYLMGICLGMQMLFSRSFEGGEYKGLNLIEGDIVSFRGRISKELKIPQIGWNMLNIQRDCSILKGLRGKSFMYFVHSFFAQTDDRNIYASVEYGVDVPAVVGYKNIFGCQFHPEKSGEIGLEILRNFNRL